MPFSVLHSCPWCLNALQFWCMDNILMKKLPATQLETRAIVLKGESDGGGHPQKPVLDSSACCHATPAATPASDGKRAAAACSTARKQSMTERGEVAAGVVLQPGPVTATLAAWSSSSATTPRQRS
jgi:hypothetical protein